MLIDDFDKQSDFYNSIFSFAKNNKLSHAYLIETRNCSDIDTIINNFVRILYSSHTGNDNNLVSLQEMINNGNYIEIKLESDTTMIKKDQVMNIQEKFMTKAWDDKNRIYVIYDADKLNKQAANSLLKFLEEPEEGIIGILVSDNRYRVLETLRCQILSLKNDNSSYKFDSLDLLIDLVNMLEKRRINSIAYLPIVCRNEYFSREKWKEILTALQYIYEQALRNKVNHPSQDDFKDIVETINNNNEINNLLYKIDVLSKQIEKLEYNLNINSMLDQFIINFTGGGINA